jgi:hypothetical protein
MATKIKYDGKTYTQAEILKTSFLEKVLADFTAKAGRIVNHATVCIKRKALSADLCVDVCVWEGARKGQMTNKEGFTYVAMMNAI